MGRFTPIDLSRLPPLPATALTFEQYFAAYMADLTTRLNGVGIPYNVGSTQTDTYAITGQSYSYRTELVAQSIDGAIKAVLLPTSYGAYLDNLGATQDPPVARNPGELDDPYRQRIALAPNALSTCGPEGAYLFFAIAATFTDPTTGLLHEVASAAVYGPMSFGGTPATPFVPLGQVLIPVLSNQADGTAPAGLVAAVQASVDPDQRRPIADFVTASAATIQDYTISATLYVGSGADPGTVLNAAFGRALAAVTLAHVPGGQVLDQDLYAALKVPDANGAPIVTKVVLNSWTDVNGTDPIPGANGPAFIAPYCPGLPAGQTAPTLTANTDGSTTLTGGGITLQLIQVDD